MKNYTTYLLLLFSVCLFSQKKNLKEFSIKSDNDLYVSLSKDRYYTSGMFLSYRFSNKKNLKKATKRVYELKIGQELYSPFKANVANIKEHDRPFAGYLFGGFGFSNFYKNGSILKISTEIGVLGENALGEETMSLVHNIYGYRTPSGWRHQISNAFAFSLNANYIKDLFTTTYFNLNWVNKVRTGTIFNNLSTGINARIGLTPLKDISNSISYNGNLQSINKKEAFFYIKPIVNYTFFDATIQGSFLNNNSPVTYDIKPFVLSTEFGISYAVQKINIGYSVILHSKKLKSSRVPQTNRYGSIFISYLFN